MVDVIEKLSQIINNDKDIADNFYKKWGIDKLNILNKLQDNGFHGGVYSKIKSLENLNKIIKKGTSVINIGPETGAEVFLLSELGANICVCEPDTDNLNLLKEISQRYKNEDGSKAIDQTTFKLAGFKLDRKKILAEKRNYHTVLKVQNTGLPTFYNISSKIETLSTLETKGDLVFIHKILTSLSRFSPITPTEIFIKAIEELWDVVAPDGLISWTEPSQLFENNFKLKIKGKKIKQLEYILPNVNEKYIQFLIYK